jgi:hypothetical protein
MKRYLTPALISAILTLTVWLYTHDKSSSLIIGLLVNLTLLLIEPFEIVTKVSKFLDTRSGLVDCSDRTASVAARMRSLEKGGSSIQQWLAEQALARIDDNLGSLNNGLWTVHSLEGFVDIATKLYDHEFCRHEYWGTSVMSDFKGYWQSSHGKRFNHLALNAIKTGIVIKRIFIFEETEEKNEMYAIMFEQYKSGIDVRYLAKGDAPTGTPALDLGIWDQSVAVVLTEPQYQGSAFRATLHLKLSEVRHLTEIFDSLYSAATKFEPNETGNQGRSPPTSRNPRHPNQ